MRRVKQILWVGGICVAVIGFMALPFPRTNPKAITQSLFERVAMTGAFTQPGLILVCVGIGCLALSALLPSGRQQAGQGVSRPQARAGGDSARAPRRAHHPARFTSLLATHAKSPSTIPETTPTTGPVASIMSRGESGSGIVAIIFISSACRTA
jgi:hypothetical protein